jgi:hypothetical protein
VGWGSDTKKREALEVEVYSPFLQLKLISPGTGMSLW